MLKVKRFTANLHFFKICLEEIIVVDKIGRKCPKKTLTGQIYLSILIFMLKVKRFTANLHFFKICLEEIIVVRKTIDMSRLDKLKIDGEVANYLVQWDNTLLLTAYDQNRMFVEQAG